MTGMMGDIVDDVSAVLLVFDRRRLVGHEKCFSDRQRRRAKGKVTGLRAAVRWRDCPPAATVEHE